MQFRDLGAQYSSLKEKIDAAIREVIDSHAFILGAQVSELEERLAEYVGVKHCLTCASGTDALTLPLMAWNIGVGDAVFAPDFTFFGTINCAILRGATPVLVDIDERTFNISCDALEKTIIRTIKEGRLTPKVIIPVDLFGQPAEHEKIQLIADKYNLKVLEDGAQGLGGSISNKKACSFGDAAATSFFPAKPLGCYGDGGAIFTNDDELYEKLRSLRISGASIYDKYQNMSAGLNSRLDTLQAAILKVKLEALETYELRSANYIAQLYTENLGNNVVTPYIKPGYFSCWSQYTILLEDASTRNKLREYLSIKGIPSMIYYPRGMHQQPAMKAINVETPLDFPVTENIVNRCLSLPMHPYLDMQDVRYVSISVIECLDRLKSKRNN